MYIQIQLLYKIVFGFTRIRKILWRIVFKVVLPIYVCYFVMENYSPQQLIICVTYIYTLVKLRAKKYFKSIIIIVIDVGLIILMVNAHWPHY